MLEREIPRSSAWRLIVISLFVLSMSATLSLWDKSRFFFKPVQVNFLLTDLAVKLGNQCLIVLSFYFSPVAEQIQQTLQGNRFPVPNLARMHLIQACQFRGCLLLFDRLQGNFGLKIGRASCRER